MVVIPPRLWSVPLTLALLVWAAPASAQNVYRYANLDGKLSINTDWHTDAPSAGADTHLVFGADADGDPVTFGSDGLAGFTVTHDTTSTAFVINRVILMGDAGVDAPTNVLSNNETAGRLFRFRGANAGVYNESEVDYDFGIRLQGGDFEDFTNLTLGGDGTGIVTLSVAQAISAQKAFDVIKTGTSTFVLAGTAVATVGDFYILAGTLIADNSSAFSSGTSTVYLGDTTGSADATLRLAKNISQNIVVRAGSSGTLTLAVDWANFSGDLTLHRDLTIVNDGGGNGIFSGAISSSTDITLTLNNASLVRFDGDNTYSGTTRIAGSSAVRATHNNAFGSSLVELASDVTIQLAPGVVVNNDLSILAGTGNRTLRLEDGSEWAGDITLERAIRFAAPSTATSDMVSTISGDISGAFALTKLAYDAVLVLTGDNSYTGNTNVNGGALLVNGTHTGAGNYIVAEGATLGGTGSVTFAANRGATVAVGATLAPGNSIGTLTLNGDLAIDGTFQVQLALASSDQVLGVNQLTLGEASILDLIVLADPTVDQFLLIEYTTRTGEFAFVNGLSDSAYLLYNDDAGQLLLMFPTAVIPVPAALPAGLTLIGLLALRRPRR